MVLFKSCPRCQTGDLVEKDDMYGVYVQCLQCGYVRDVPRQQAPRDVQHARDSIDRCKKVGAC